MPAACPASPKQHTTRKGSIRPGSTPSPWTGSEGLALPGPFSGLGLHPMRMISHAATGDWGNTHTTSHIQGHQHRFGNRWARSVALSGAAHPRQMMTWESIPTWTLSQETTTPIEHQETQAAKSKYHGLSQSIMVSCSTETKVRSVRKVMGPDLNCTQNTSIGCFDVSPADHFETGSGLIKSK